MAAVDVTIAMLLRGQSTASRSTRVLLPASAVAASLVCTRSSRLGRPCRSRVHSRQASTLVRGRVRVRVRVRMRVRVGARGALAAGQHLGVVERR